MVLSISALDLQNLSDYPKKKRVTGNENISNLLYAVGKKNSEGSLILKKLRTLNFETSLFESSFEKKLSR